MDNGAEIGVVVGDDDTITVQEGPGATRFVGPDKAGAHMARFGRLAEPGFSLISLDMTPATCDLSPHSDFAPGFCTCEDGEHAVWLIRWRDGAGKTDKLKLCDLHRRALAELLSYPDPQ